MKKNELSFLWRSLLGGASLVAFCFLAPSAVRADEWDDAEAEEEGDEFELQVEWEGSDRQLKMQEIKDGFIAEERSSLEQKITPRNTAEIIENLIRRRMKDPELGDFSIFRLPGITLDWRSNYDKRPQKTLSEIEDKIAIDADNNAEERLRPEEQKRAIREQAEERFRMIKKGERVNLQLRGGRGANANIINKPFRSVNDEYVQLGERTIIKEDLEPEDQAKFYPDINAEMKEAYIVNNCGKVDVEFDSLVSAYIYNNTAEQYRANFYVPDISKPTANLRTAKKDFWVPMYDFVTKVRTTLIDRGLKQFEAVELPAKMQESGYFLVDTKDGKGKEWVDEAEKLLREMPAPAPNNGMGPDGIMMDSYGGGMGGPGMMGGAQGGMGPGAMR